MLILRRTEGQKVYLKDKSGNIIAVITTFKLRKGSMKMGIEARDDIDIVRKEIAGLDKTLQK